MTLLLLISLLLLGAFILLIYLGFRRPAFNNPRSFLKHPPQTSRKHLVLFGDSQTHSTLSSDYASMLRTALDNSFTIINAGQNGDTAAGLLRRVQKDVLPCLPDLVVIYVGTNDVMRKVPLPNYSNDLSQVIQQIKSVKNIPVALVAFPPLGENLHSRMNAEVDLFNQSLLTLAMDLNITYLPFNEALKTYLSDKHITDQEEFSMKISRLLLAAFKKYYLGQSFQQISRANQLHVLSDGIHLNDVAGNILADMIRRWICGSSHVAQVALMASSGKSSVR